MGHLAAGDTQLVPHGNGHKMGREPVKASPARSNRRVRAGWFAVVQDGSDLGR